MKLTYEVKFGTSAFVSSKYYLSSIFTIAALYALHAATNFPTMSFETQMYHLSLVIEQLTAVAWCMKNTECAKYCLL